MKVLALNTAFANSDIAVDIDGTKDFISHSSSAKQSENALVCIDELLKRNNTKIQNIDTMSVVIGPGSFTGIRIGVGLVKGMAVAKPSVKLIGICSLDLLAYTFFTQTQCNEFSCVLDALSVNIFVCSYKNGERTSEPKMLTGDELDNLKGKVVGLKAENLDFCTDFVEFNPQMLMEYTEQKIEQNEFVDEANLLPLYLRKSQAEAGLDSANKKI